MNTMKKQALLDVLKFVGISIAGGLAGSALVNLVPLEYIGLGACAIGLGFALKAIYNVRLEHYERQEYLNQPIYESTKDRA